MTPATPNMRLATITLLALASLSLAWPAGAVTVFSGFSASGIGMVTASNGPGSDAPPLALPTLSTGSLQLYNPLAADISPDATGDFSFDRSQGILDINIYNQSWPASAYPISGWSFSYPGSYVGFSLNHGVVTDFHFHALAFGGSYADLTPGLFSVHFDNGFQVYDFSGTWTVQSLGIQTQTFAVPEPTTWAVLILGFGLTGLALRDRRRRREPSALPRFGDPFRALS